AGELQAMLPLDVAVVAASHGAHRLACEYAQILGAPVATIQRDIAGDVAGRPCLLVDDMIATGSTMISAAEAVLAAGAAPDLTVVATHAIFSEGTREKFELIDPIRRIVVTDSVPRAEGEWMKLRVVSVAPLLADAIAMAHAGLPVQKRYKPVEVG
ncbi:MAG TPA: phosphoribosyltransferase family protein, partial [Thermoanaerobaculia bacterium]|nr:phosphoribosyltransferase family protein [Thermoanaerobaculia bacterium]